MRARAADGLRVPMEHAPRSYITTKPHELPDTVYYRRRLATGELVIVEPKPADQGASHGKASSKGPKA